MRTENQHMNQARLNVDDVRAASGEGDDALDAWTIGGEYGADL